MSRALDGFMLSAPVVPVVVIEDERHAVMLARTLIEGGIGVIEVTLRSAAALASIEAIARAVPAITLAVGTVINAAQLQAARDAGAAVAISPGIDPDLIDASVRIGMPLLPGVASASELMLGLNAGLSRFKLFPATAINGLELAKAFAGPFPDARFCPTGGISFDAAATYLAQPNILCVGASWIAPATDIRAERWEQIRKNALKAASLRSA